MLERGLRRLYENRLEFLCSEERERERERERDGPKFRENKFLLFNIGIFRIKFNYHELQATIFEISRGMYRVCLIKQMLYKTCMHKIF